MLHFTRHIALFTLLIFTAVVVMPMSMMMPENASIAINEHCGELSLDTVAVSDNCCEGDCQYCLGNSLLMANVFFIPQKASALFYAESAENFPHSRLKNLKRPPITA